MISYKKKYFLLKSKYDHLESEFYKITLSKGWKYVNYLYTIKDKSKVITKYIKLKKFINYGIKKIFTVFDQKSLDKIISSSTNKTIIIYPPTIDWNIPLFQRPQHVAIELSKLNFLFFYCTSNQYDNIFGFKRIKPNLYLTNRYDLLKKIRQNDRWIIIHAAHPTFTLEEIRKLKKDGFNIVYDYVDKIDEKISGDNVLISQRHSKISSKEIDLGLATATNLYKELSKKIGNSKTLYNPNGVNCEHFKPSKTGLVIPKDMKPILAKHRPIVGYYGALAKWIDYSLLNKIARSKNNWQLVLIGWNFDKSISELVKLPNIHYLGIKNYQELPNYARLFDVAIIPFKKGGIAKSTSPLKLFEYFALQKPVVITRDLVECQKYEGVYHSKNSNQFIENIKMALSQKNNQKLKKMLAKQSKDNSWENRAKDIAKYIRSN